MKGGRKRGAAQGEKARKRMRTILEQLKITESQKQRHQRPPKALASFLGAAERPELAQGHTTNLEMMLEPTLRPHEPQTLICLIGSRLG